MRYEYEKEPLTDVKDVIRFLKQSPQNPYYDFDTDYTTNSPSYYDYLAKLKPLIQILAERIYDYDRELAKRFEEWDELIKKFPENVEKLLIEWLEDGTLEKIINENIFGDLNRKIDNLDKSVDDRINDFTSRTDKKISDFENRTDKRIDDLTTELNELLDKIKNDIETSIDEMNQKIDIEFSVSPLMDNVFEPKPQKSTQLGTNGIPDTDNSDENLKATFDTLVDNDYVKKSIIGKDESNQYNIYKYVLEPKNYNKTVIVTACLHGNEKTGFYSLWQFANLLVNKWNEHTQLAYIRKNVRLVLVPIVNPYGFSNNIRQNFNRVDLNRNFNYNWDIYNVAKSKAGQDFYKGRAVESERETRVMKDLFKDYSDAVSHVDMHTIVSISSEYILFLPRFVKQDTIQMSKMIQSLRYVNENVVYGTSYLPSMGNYFALTHNINSYTPEFYNGMYGSERNGTEMTRALRWYGNVIIQACKIPYKATIETIEDTDIINLDYRDDRGGAVARISTTNDKFSTFELGRYEFIPKINGIVEVDGYIVLNLSQDATISINPALWQNFAPFFSRGATEKRRNFEITLELKAGDHYIPIKSNIFAQTSTTKDNSRRTKEVVSTLRLKKSNGVVTIKQYNVSIKFTPTNSNVSYKMLESTEAGNKGRDTYKITYPNYNYYSGDYDEYVEIEQ